MPVDDFLPVYDVSDSVATQVGADLAATWDALLNVRRPLVGVLGALRVLPELVTHLLHGESPPQAPTHLRLQDLVNLPRADGGWVLLGERPRDEIALGLIGKFWRPVIEYAAVSMVCSTSRGKQPKPILAEPPPWTREAGGALPLGGQPTSRGDTQMNSAIDVLLRRFQNGQMSRRDVVTSLAALFVASGEATAQPAGPPVGVRSLNHVSISVADIKRSVDFYQSLFGMTVKSQQGVGANKIAGGDGTVVNLAPGPGPEFLGIYQGKPTGHIGHFCLGVQNFEPERVLKTLQDRGVKASMRTRGESKEIFLTDPDNVSVQLTDVTYCGGEGVRGNRCTA